MQSRDEKSGLFVTNSRQALDYLLKKTPETENLFSIDATPAMEKQVEKTVKWSKELMKYLDIVTESSKPLKCDHFTMVPDDLKCDPNVSLSLYLVPGASPLEYFSRLIGSDPTLGKIKNNRGRYKNTLIGHIGFSA
jgi:hypothetical protein